MLESTQQHQNTIQSVIKTVDKWYMQNASNLVNSIRFDVKRKIDLKKARLLMAYEEILCNRLNCDYEITQKFLEKVKLTAK